MKDIETSEEATTEEETTEEEVDTKDNEEVETDDDVKAEDYQDDARAAWYKGDEHVAQDKKANPQRYKKAPIKKKLT
jgi:hypothetical protein